MSSGPPSSSPPGAPQGRAQTTVTIFRQSPEPGRMALSDFTDAGGLGVTIAGAPFAHRL